ncbi:MULTISPECIES: hypothetical protein [unclassified Caballeronia]|uniref:hypothetical protein n=1 Tax=unclassified Caballeronia TaxID=2646786 RepID=UPI0020283337|nr:MULTISPECIES: hypothetical protein [unclassified Caballeronia]
MKIHKPLMIVVCAFLFALARASAQTVTFKVTETASASVRLKDRSVHVDVRDTIFGLTSQDIELDTESAPHIGVDDYGFDGTRGFSVWYLDEGMATSTISRVFLYSPIRRGFVEIRPKCADEFVNLRVDRLKHVLVSTYYDGNEPKLCRTETRRLNR